MVNATLPAVAQGGWWARSLQTPIPFHWSWSSMSATAALASGLEGLRSAAGRGWGRDHAHLLWALLAVTEQAPEAHWCGVTEAPNALHEMKTLDRMTRLRQNLVACAPSPEPNSSEPPDATWLPQPNTPTTCRRPTLNANNSLNQPSNSDDLISYRSSL
jgi:hypothetical protein